MKSFRFLALAMCLLFAASGAALADHHEGKCARGGHECGKGDCGSKKDCDKSSSQCPIVTKILKKSEFYLDNAEEIGLSDAQVAQIKEIKTAVTKDEIMAKAQMEIGMMDMEALLKTDPVDVESFNTMIDSFSTQMNTAAKKTVQTYAQLKAILSPDQKAAAKKLHAKKKD